ncbi:hypothetical protein E1263_08160 [Kribbella antibiotica]|uniref:DUF222 domain-containing protein n=1 Tax=Kribbella antibiotica TaxID=190195 RepID=A0A4R4ZVJ8_9ACTN|nr:hypothetical protein [Kribbella antibiotica]TDD61152.1 hypothetical protein E1263_08160 [Kribbella antibiotica]
MFENELAELSTTDLMESAAGERTAENRSATRSLVHAVVYADRFHPDVCAVRPGRRVSDGRERAVVLGGDGCPPVMEFCIGEYGAVLGLSPGVARQYLADSLSLRHRFPFVWARVLTEEVTAWKARNLARDCEKLSLAAALTVDKKVAPLLDTISPTRLAKIIKAAKMYADPDLAKAEAAETTAERGVWVGQSDEHGTKTCVIKAASAAVRRHKAKIDEIADALQAQGDKRSIQARRAEAIGIMPDSAFADELIARAREHQRTNPMPDANPGPSSDASPSPDAGPSANIETSPASSRASVRAPYLAPARARLCVPASAPSTAPDPEPCSGPGSGSAPALARSSAPASASAPARNVIGASGGNLAPSSVAAGNDISVDRVAGMSVPPGFDGEPGLDDEADREAPHPSTSDLPDPLDQSVGWATEPFEAAGVVPPESAEAMSADELRALAARLAQVKHDAHSRPRGERSVASRPAKTEVFVHLTDHTLATGDGVLRAEEIGPLLASQFTELVGYGPYAVKPVIDLNQAVSSDAYEITHQIRECVKLTHPVELFPYGTRETSNTIDLDHIEPYDSLGPPGQTSLDNLAPLSRFGHRVKTHADGWRARRIDRKTLEWTTPHGFVFRVDPTGTHRISKEAPDG